jgi:hypothetical protein
VVPDFGAERSQQQEIKIELGQLDVAQQAFSRPGYYRFDGPIALRRSKDKATGAHICDGGWNLVD